MKVVARADEYTIYQKRNQRYAVQDKYKQWIRGDDKVAILLSHKLIEAAMPKAPEPPEAAEAEAADTGAEAEAGTEAAEAQADEAAEADSPEGEDAAAQDEDDKS